MDTKTSQAINLWNQGKVIPALRIFKTFRIGISKDDKRNIEIAYECLTGKSDFYTSIGIEVEKVKNDAFCFLCSTYNLKANQIN